MTEVREANEREQQPVEVPQNAEEPNNNVSDAERRAARKALIQLTIVFVIGLLWAASTSKLATVLLVLLFFGMIMFHEFGHFVAAKKAGMKCTEFFVGFGPRLWSVNRGETEYGIKAFPLGGYVKIIGMSNLEEVPEEDEPRTYRQQPFLKRFMVAFAGPLTHFLMAFVILVIVFTMVGEPQTTKAVGALTQLPNATTPAQAAGLRVGDEIIKLNGTDVRSWDEVQIAVCNNVDKPLTMNVLRDGQPVDVIVTPVDRSTLGVTFPTRCATDRPVGFLGAGPQHIDKTYSFPAALGKSVDGVRETSVAVVESIGKVFSPSGLKSYVGQLTNEEEREAPEAAETRFVSVVGLVNIADNAAENGWRSALAFLFALNMFVGIFNLIPLLPLDGGHIAVACYERLRSFGGRKYMVDFAKLLPVSYAVIAMMLFIFVSALFLYIVSPLACFFQEALKEWWKHDSTIPTSTDPTDQGRQGSDWWRRADNGAVDDHDKDG